MADEEGSEPAQRKSRLDGDSEHLEEVLGATGGDNFGRRYKFAADPGWITICNLLMRKIGQEMRGGMRKNYYAFATPFYFSEACANTQKLSHLLVARAGIYLPHLNRLFK